MFVFLSLVAILAIGEDSKWDFDYHGHVIICQDGVAY